MTGSNAQNKENKTEESIDNEVMQTFYIPGRREVGYRRRTFQDQIEMVPREHGKAPGADTSPAWEDSFVTTNTEVRQRARRGSLPMLVLSMIEQSSDTGYMIAYQIERLTKGRWHIDPSRVYPILKKFYAEGLIQEDPMNLDSDRGTCYEITDKGREYADSVRDQIEAAWQYLEDQTRQALANEDISSKIEQLEYLLNALPRLGLTEEQERKVFEELEQTQKTLYGVLAK